MGTKNVEAKTLVDALMSVVEQGAQDKHAQSMLTAVARARIEVCACQDPRRLCITVTLAAVCRFYLPMASYQSGICSKWPRLAQAVWQDALHKMPRQVCA